MDDRIDRLLNVLESIEDGSLFEDIVINIAELMAREAEEAYTETVEDWYNDGHRTFYRPQGSLKEAYEITNNSSGSVIDIDFHTGAELMSGDHRWDNDSLFDLIWNQGYHGGPLVPVPKYTGALAYNGGDSPWEPMIPFKKVEAEQSTPPDEALEEKIDEINAKYTKRLESELVSRFKEAFSG